METFLCHSCFERNQVNAEVCIKCNAVLKDNNSEVMVKDFIKSLTKLSHQRLMPNPLEFRIVILFNLFLGVNFMLIASFLYNIDPHFHIDFMGYIVAFYLLSLLTFFATQRLVSRRKSAVKSILLLLPAQIGLLTTFVINMRLFMFYTNRGIGILPAWVSSFPNWYLYLVIYCIILSVMFSLQVYFVLFNAQVRQQLIF